MFFMNGWRVGLGREWHEFTRATTATRSLRLQPLRDGSLRCRYHHHCGVPRPLRSLQGREFRLQAESELAPTLTVSQNIAVGSTVPALRKMREKRGTRPGAGEAEPVHVKAERGVDVFHV